MISWSVIEGDCRDVLRSLDAGSVQTCVTSPPYFGLRDYGTGEWEGGEPSCDHVKTTSHREQPDRPKGWDGAFRHTSQPLPVAYGTECGRCGARRVDRQIGLEPTPDEFVAALVGVFREVRRALADDGTVWLNLGDSYARQGGDGAGGSFDAERPGWHPRTWREASNPPAGLKPKDLIGIPWMVAFALRADGWYLRSEIIWHKPNPMPESVTDRPTKSHEQLFLLSKSARYFYDADAVREPQSPESLADHLRRKPSDRANGVAPDRGPGDQGLRQNGVMTSGTRNRRTVWTIPTQGFSGPHFAPFPPKLIEPCILAGSREGDTVLDPFSGAGTTGMVALRHGRSYVGIELNPAYAQMARHRIVDDAPLLNALSQLDEAA